ncbi:ribonuclease H-like domain-containing protein [Rhizophagus irregularis DAOM 181602=DAOM 197198]|nr:ribonuclease H-like domain-containing protein [Rhizophagus irregularis DAOM 181602=DAOM 197198]
MSGILLYLPTDICQIIMGDLFWSYILQLATLMKPYCRALDKLQINKARLYDVALSFEYFIKFWEQNTDRFLSEGIISRLKKRWNDWKQFILLLSLTSEKPTKLLAQFEFYQVKKPLFNNETYEQFGDDVLAYWYYCSTMCKKLGFIATKIFTDIHQTENEKKRKCESEKIKVNIALPIIELGEQETVTTEQDWTEHLNEWNELLMEEERAQNLNVTEESLNCSDNDLLNSYIHPAINTDAK